MLHASELIAEMQQLLGDPEGDLHTDEVMLEHLNRVLRDYSNKSRSIMAVLRLALIGEQFRYGLPDLFLYLHAAKYDYYGQPIPLKRARHLAVENYTNFTGIPTHYTTWGRSVLEKVIGTEVQEVTSEGYIVLDANYGILTNDRFYNLTDGSEAAITEVDRDNNRFKIGVLEGASRQVEHGDMIRITTRQAPNHTLIIVPAPDEDDAVGEESLSGFMSIQHYKVLPADLENGNDLIELDLEFEEAIIHKTLYWARSVEQEETSAAAQDNYEKAEASFNKNIGYVRKRTRELVNAWDSSDYLDGGFVRYQSRLIPPAPRGDADDTQHPFNRHII